MCTIKRIRLQISTFLLSLAILIPNSTFARHKKEYQDLNAQEYTQKVPEQKRDRTVLGSTLGFGALGAITAGAAGSAQWTPVGLVGGVLAGWAIGKAIEHSKKKKNQRNNYVVHQRNHKHEY